MSFLRLPAKPHRTDHSAELSSALHKIQVRLHIFSVILKEQYHKSCSIDDAILREWLQLKNALNMHRVSDAYYRGSLYYSLDSSHFASEKSRGERYCALTTTPHLDPIVYLSAESKAAATFINYKVSDTCKSSARVLEDLLVSCTSVDCGASINISFHLTILDLLKLIHGDELGTRFFDKLFGPKLNDSHDFNRMRVGKMGINQWEEACEFSPICYFAFGYRVSIEQIKQNPEDFIGMRIYIAGHQDYLEKFIEGHAVGWNAVVLGQNSHSELLYLIANEVGRPYVYTHHEMLALLRDRYNLFPGQSTPKFADKCTLNDVGNSGGRGDFFHLSRIKQLLTHFDLLMEDLKKYCDQRYQTQMLNKGFRFSRNRKHAAFVLTGIVKESKDDADRQSLSFFKQSYRKDIKRNFTVDDAQLHIGYKNRKKTESESKEVKTGNTKSRP